MKARLEALKQTLIADLISMVCPVPPIPRIQVSTLSRNAKLFVVPTVKAASLLLVVGLAAQLVAMHVAVYASPQPAYVYRKSAGSNPLGDSFDVGVDFDVPGLFLPSAQVVVDVASHMEPPLAGGDALGFRLNYYCNGQYMWTESDNIYAPGDGQDAGPRQAVVPVDIMKAGKNRLVIHVSVDSVAGDIKAYAFSYYLDGVEVRASNREAFIPILILSASLLYLTWGMLPKVGRRWSSQQLYGE